ncbi:MAG TPA: hypothetical protein DCS17_09850 [Flavobacterium sp.]|nr:hypothetical protein [Flavobacterium sp.]
MLNYSDSAYTRLSKDANDPGARLEFKRFFELTLKLNSEIIGSKEFTLLEQLTNAMNAAPVFERIYTLVASVDFVITAKKQYLNDKTEAKQNDYKTAINEVFKQYKLISLQCLSDIEMIQTFWFISYEFAQRKTNIISVLDRLKTKDKIQHLENELINARLELIKIA